MQLKRNVPMSHVGRSRLTQNIPPRGRNHSDVESGRRLAWGWQLKTTAGKGRRDLDSSSARPSVSWAIEWEAAGDRPAAPLAERLKALGHPLRLRILFTLRRAPMRVGDLGAFLDAAQPIISQQLRILRLAGLVEPSRQPGRPYQLASAGIAALLDAVEEYSEGERLLNPTPSRALAPAGRSSRARAAGAT